MPLEIVEKQARYLATENRKSDPDITRIYWFPDEQEVRLVELTELIPVSDDGRVHAVYFGPDPRRQLPAASGIALIRPNEFQRLELPESWGRWEDAVLIGQEDEP